MANTFLTIPALIILLGTLILFHELGHFGMAKLLRIKVQEFAFGFGPKWIRLFKRGDTEYTIHPVPLGGFVKLAGMEPGEESVPGGFNSKPWWARFLVCMAGPLMSFVLAYAIFCTLGIFIGVPKAVNQVDRVERGSRAQQAGLRPGDRVVEISGERIQTGSEMVEIIHGSASKPLVIVVNRDGRIIRVHATPVPGKLGKGIGLLGFTPVQRIERIGIVESVRFGNDFTFTILKLIVVSLFSRDVAKNVGGPIAIVAATRASVEGGVGGFLQWLGVMSLMLGVVNLLPLLVTDGGWMLLLIVEAARRRRLSPRTWETAHRVGWTLILTILMLVMYLDLSKLVSGKLLP
ncbi:MAG TPA: M50 family metallopeptidase [Armatimonadota bacterium]|nr:M50 family metallopeptidase [Armatimonadota bacterium]